jgi:hypothetical protein
LLLKATAKPKAGFHPFFHVFAGAAVAEAADEKGQRREGPGRDV